MSLNLKSIRDKINKQKTELPDVDSMTKEELLDYVLDSFKKYYDSADIKNLARYSISKNFYQGVDRGFWECERIVIEIQGRLKNNGN
jgi:hypothetical protein